MELKGLFWHVAEAAKHPSGVVEYGVPIIIIVSHMCRCYAAKPSTEVVSQSERELEPLKLPGKLGEFTGNVLYPDDNSAVWDVNGV